MRNASGLRTSQDRLATCSAAFRIVVAIGGLWILLAATAARAEAAPEGLAWLSRTVATVIATDESGQTVRIGSGVVLSSDGFIATTDRMIEDADRVAVELPGGSARQDVSVLHRDARRGLAILWSAEGPLAAATLSASEWIDMGEPVLALQSPKLPGTAQLPAVIGGVAQDDGDMGYIYLQGADLSGADFGGRPIVNHAGSLVGLGIGRLAGSVDMASAMPVADLRVALARARETLRARTAPTRPDRFGRSGAGEPVSTPDPRPAVTFVPGPSAERLYLTDLAGSFIPPPPPAPGPVSPDQVAAAKRVHAKTDELARITHGVPITRLGTARQMELYFEALRLLGIEK